MSAKKNSSAARQARVEEMRRAERARERRHRILMIGGSVLIVAGLVVGGTFLIRSQSDDSEPDRPDRPGRFVTGKDGVKTWEGKLGRSHVTKTVNYPMEPPVGGDHHPVWQNCDGDVYPDEIKNEHAVHSLEHGAVWVTYSSKASEAEVKALKEKVEKTPYTLMSPVEDQKDPLMLSAWGHQRTVKSASDPNVNKFFETYVQGKQTPEPGAACTKGVS